MTKTQLEQLAEVLLLSLDEEDCARIDGRDGYLLLRAPEARADVLFCAIEILDGLPTVPLDAIIDGLEAVALSRRVDLSSRS